MKRRNRDDTEVDKGSSSIGCVDIVYVVNRIPVSDPPSRSDPRALLTWYWLFRNRRDHDVAECIKIRHGATSHRCDNMVIIDGGIHGALGLNNFTLNKMTLSSSGLSPFDY